MALLAGMALVCGGCGNYEPTLPSDYHGVPVSPVPGTPSPPPTPSTSVEDGLRLAGTPRQNLAQQMADSLAWQIGQWEPVSTDCDAKLVFKGPTKTFDCNARWGGASIPFEVTIGGNANPFYTLQAAQLKGLIVATEVRQAWSQRYAEDAYVTASEGTSLTCADSIPKVAVVALNAPTPYECTVAGSLYYAEIAVDPLGVSEEYEVTFTNHP